MPFSENVGAYEDLTDEQLALLAKDGSARAASVLISRFSPLVRAKASKYRFPEIDGEDLAQEGMIGLLSAVCTYDGTVGALFRTYASICVGNSIISFVKAFMRQKRIPTGGYSVLDEYITDVRPNPEEQVIEQDELRRMKNLLFSRLSETERNVITLYLAGCSYDEIAARLDLTTKSVDNALQRVRRKLRKT